MFGLKYTAMETSVAKDSRSGFLWNRERRRWPESKKRFDDGVNSASGDEK